MGTVIAFINQKGGCAKSTTSVHFAYWLNQKKQQKVLLVDSDAQKSSSIWLDSMETKIPFQVIQSPDDLLEQIPNLALQQQYIVVDGPAALSETTRAILFRADIAVVPCQPTGVDLRSAADTVRLINQAQSVRKGAPEAAVFISRAVKGTKLLDEAEQLLSQTKVPILKSKIYQRQIIADTFGQRATVWDLNGKPATDSSKEFDNLFKEILKIHH
ncbi:MAG: AAA family ATPase [Oculatellaceae cyanobacterium Prado106]|jgi:chromosome partitioning protein|nr:AAA family ATPase [Oculatellaceae cyanobacterium Prado106]